MLRLRHETWNGRDLSKRRVGKAKDQAFQSLEGLTNINTLRLSRKVGLASCRQVLPDSSGPSTWYSGDRATYPC